MTSYNKICIFKLVKTLIQQAIRLLAVIINVSPTKVFLLLLLLYKVKLNNKQRYEMEQRKV
jgi:hypothetical protein